MNSNNDFHNFGSAYKNATHFKQTLPPKNYKSKTKYIKQLFENMGQEPIQEESENL